MNLVEHTEVQNPELARESKAQALATARLPFRRSQSRGRCV